MKYTTILITGLLLISQSCWKEKHCHCHGEFGYQFTPIEGFNTLFKWEDALKCSKTCDKPILVKFTAFGQEIREMKEIIRESSSIKRLINSEYVLVELYVNDKATLLDSSEWITTSNGRVLKYLGQYNSHLQTTLFNVNHLPYWAVVDSYGTPLGVDISYTLSTREFKRFLSEGIHAFEKKGKNDSIQNNKSTR